MRSRSTTAGGLSDRERPDLEQPALRDDFADVHPDLIQTWSGPKSIRLDRFTGYTDYQGLTWMRAAEDDVYPESITARNVNIRALAPQPHTVAKWPDGSTRDKPDMGAALWHVSSSTTFSCWNCFIDAGWYQPTYKRKLDDSIGGFLTGDGSYVEPPYELRGRDGAKYRSPSTPKRGAGDKTDPRISGAGTVT